MKILSSTYTFQHYDKAVNLQSKIVSFISKSKKLEHKDYEEVYNTIKKHFTFLGTSDIISYLDKGEIGLFYSHDVTTKLPDSLPCVLIKSDSVVRAVVDVTNITTYDKIKDVYTINDRKLFANLITGYLMLKFQRDDMKSIRYDSYIIDTTCQLYASLFIKIFNKIYRLNTDKYEHDKCFAMIYKFAYLNLFSDNPAERAKINTSNLLTTIKKHTNVNEEYLKTIDEKFVITDFDDLNSFIKKLASEIKGISELNVTSFLENYIKMYGTSTIFGLEHISYFYHMLFSCMIGAFVNNQYNIENVIEKDVDRLYMSIIKKYLTNI